MGCACPRSLATDVARLIRHADCPPVPWKNGAGTTRELWALRDAGGVLVRISIAEITGAQPFSEFPGTDRIIAQLDGPPMVLTIDGIVAATRYRLVAQRGGDPAIAAIEAE